MKLKRLFRCVVAVLFIQVAMAGHASAAQSVSADEMARIAKGVEDYYKVHPDKRPKDVAGLNPVAAEVRPNEGCALPKYPKDALRNEQQGNVDLYFLIDVDGTVLNAKVKKSTGYPSLDVTAMEALQKCKFKPAMENGQPVQAWMEVRYRWFLE